MGKVPTHLLIVIFFIISCHLFSQQKQIDSLNNVIKTAKHDTSVTNAYNSLSTLFSASNPDTIIPLSNKAFAIIEKALPAANSKEKRTFLLIKADALNNMGYVYQLKGDFEKSLEYF